MRRRSIVDLAGGYQPISAERLRLCVVFDLEIYKLRRAARSTRWPYFLHSAFLGSIASLPADPEQCWFETQVN